MAAEHVLDNRGLEPPEPMVRVLDTLSTLADGDVLVVHNDRRPMFLFPRLDALGYRYSCEDQPDGTVVLRITRGPGGSATAESAQDGGEDR
ncbi:MAG TPA: DUF2249 domain-containing protein [Bacillota bacterium]